ncbi:GNAT family N-acetyltransferase [Echinimonas agarilytica]|uniref:GNAT family N-acetyltransferase n=1 Tax=Echinimonas agarilytica TaxID=1215918 RepID=A0AA42B7W2_9GAMM|nr:GNAT family N-acetyltransferase [Echinimonas agarilytica]MCM2680272.1 GNAT family N-acetyltransferase [Echinimonas agarilytica]
MFPYHFTGHDGTECLLRPLDDDDGDALADFFDSLGDSTRQLFGPHPLTAAHSKLVCETIDTDSADRFVLIRAQSIIGYFILEYAPAPHEGHRYQALGIKLDPTVDPLLAPCISDPFQSLGYASLVMDYFIQYGRAIKLRSFVLMGGTQAGNALARHFYQKHGFEAFTIFQTDVENIDMRLLL